MQNVVNGKDILVKHPKMMEEFDGLTSRMKAIILFVTNYALDKFGYKMIWTEFDRTQKQQDFYYNDRVLEGYFVSENGVKHYSKDRKKRTLSVHQFKRGADASAKVIVMHTGFLINNMSDFEVQEIVSEVNNVFPYGKNGHETCIFHKVYGKTHFHFQSAI